MFDTVPRPDLPIGLPPIEQAAKMTGLEQLQALLRGEFPAPSMAQALDFWLHAVAEGEAEFRGEPSARVLNPMGQVHGGWAMTLLDSALGSAVHTVMALGEGYASLDTSVKFLRPITPQTGQVRALGKLQSRGRRIAHAEGRIEDQKGRVLALATTSCFIQPLQIAS